MGGGGMYGGGMAGMGGYDYDKEWREESLVMLIQETVAPDTWYDAGGEGTIRSYEGKKLIIYQTPEIHKEIAKLVKEMGKALGHQVSIEARFLLVSENFLEDIGLDLSAQISGGGSGGWGLIDIGLGLAEAVTPGETGVSGSWGGKAITGLDFGTNYGVSGDRLQIQFLLNAVQAHRDAKTLTAPKLTVLSGESATFSVQTETVISMPTSTYYSPGTTGYPSGYPGVPGGTEMVPQLEIFPSGTTLNITPIISPDKKHVLLTIMATLTDLLPVDPVTIKIPLPDGTVIEYEQKIPATEYSQVQTRVSVPDGGTLMLGGQKVTAEIEAEAGVPVLSKIPLVGRLFTNRTTVKDQKVLLILVRPTIILEEEVDAKALAAVESNL